MCRSYPIVKLRTRAPAQVPKRTMSQAIRLLTRNDVPALIDLIVAIELFRPEEVEDLRTRITDYLGAKETREFWIVDDDPKLGLSGVVYCAPEPMTDGTWNMYFIGVHRDRRGEGRGTKLVRHIEALVLSQNGRILIVETSATESFEKTRAFYARNGYREEARIREFYRAGDDKVVFWKSLQQSRVQGA